MDLTNTINLVLMTYITLNLMVGVGTYFTVNMAEAMPNIVSGTNTTYIDINTGELRNATDVALDNPTMESLTPQAYTGLDILVGIPIFIRDIMNIVGFPVGLVNIVYSSLYGLTVLMWSFFVVQMIRGVFVT